MSRPVLVVLGSGGRLGAAVARILWDTHTVVPLARPQIDLADPARLAGVLETQDFDALINCAAITNVDYCETHREEAFRVNRESVEVMARIASGKGARMIHISTDYVFDGETPGDLSEEAPAHPVSVYGESKRAGEIALLDVDPAHLAIRVSWVFGPDRPSFLDMLVKRALVEDRVEAITDKESSPTYTLDFVEWVRPLLPRNSAAGILHLSNSGGCSWRDYGEYALQCAAEAGLPLRATTVSPIKIADLPAMIARRPIHTVLSKARYTAITGVTPRPWQESVRDYVLHELAPRLRS